MGNKQEGTVFKATRARIVVSIFGLAIGILMFYLAFINVIDQQTLSLTIFVDVITLAIATYVIREHEKDQKALHEYEIEQKKQKEENSADFQRY